MIFFVIPSLAKFTLLKFISTYVYITITSITSNLVVLNQLILFDLTPAEVLLMQMNIKLNIIVVINET